MAINRYENFTLNIVFDNLQAIKLRLESFTERVEKIVGCDIEACTPPFVLRDSTGQPIDPDADTTTLSWRSQCQGIIFPLLGGFRINAAIILLQEDSTSKSLLEGSLASLETILPQVQGKTSLDSSVVESILVKLTNIGVDSEAIKARRLRTINGGDEGWAINKLGLEDYIPNSIKLALATYLENFVTSAANVRLPENPLLIQYVDEITTSISLITTILNNPLSSNQQPDTRVLQPNVNVQPEDFGKLLDALTKLYQAQNNNFYIVITRAYEIKKYSIQTLQRIHDTRVELKEARLDAKAIIGFLGGGSGYADLDGKTIAQYLKFDHDTQNETLYIIKEKGLETREIVNNVLDYVEHIRQDTETDIPAQLNSISEKVQTVYDTQASHFGQIMAKLTAIESRLP